MSEKWTPGPWLRDGRTVYALRETGRFHRGEPVLQNSFDVHVQGPHQHLSDVEAEATASLISAAPDLVDSIDPDTLDAIADEIGGEFKHTARAASLRGIAKRQRAALAKSRGEA